MQEGGYGSTRLDPPSPALVRSEHRLLLEAQAKFLVVQLALDVNRKLMVTRSPTLTRVGMALT